MTELKKQNYDLAFTHFKSNQLISAYNLFLNLAEEMKKNDELKAAILYYLAGECKSKQDKDNTDEMFAAGNLFLDFAKKNKSYTAKNAFLCASKYFSKAGKHNDAKNAFAKYKGTLVHPLQISRPVVIIEDSKAVVIKLKNYLQNFGYSDPQIFDSGKEGIIACKKLIEDSKNPIVLLDMGLPDIPGDVVATNLFTEQLNLQIILITADEKTTQRVSKTISSGVTAFIQKPFTIDELKRAMDLAEKEYSLSQ